MEKSLLAKKLSSIEASLTRWIFRACDYKTDLQQARHECDEAKKDFNIMNESKQKIEEKLNELEKSYNNLEMKYESEKTQQSKMKIQIKELESDLEYSNQVTKNLNEKIENLNFDLKNSSFKIESVLKEHEKITTEKINMLNNQIQTLTVSKSKLEGEKRLADKDIEALKKNLNEVKRKIELNEHENCDLKAKITKYDAEVYNIKDLKTLNEQLKSENQYFNKKIESLLTENNSIKKKFDSNLLEKNSIKCKYEEVVRELIDLKTKNQQSMKNVNEFSNTLTSTLTQTKPIASQTISVQTEDFNYDLLLRPIRAEYEQKYNDFIFKEQLYKNEIEQLKHKLSKHDNQFIVLNQNFEEECKVNMDIRERNDFLFEKCDKLKKDLQEQASEFLKFKVGYEIEKEVLETTVSQQKKFIDYIISTHPEVGKKYKLFSSKR